MNRHLIALAGAAGLVALAAPAVLSPAPQLLWNVTVSAPIGLYRVQRGGALQVGDWVAVPPPRGLDRTFAARGYLPIGVPLVKQVAAMAPSRICRQGRAIRIDGQVVTQARLSDRRGRPLPSWRGCRTLVAGQVFLLNDVPDSLDGRYFGPVSIADLVGRLRPIWTRGGD